MRVFITGATGFVGRAVVTALRESGCSVVGLVRKKTPLSDPQVTYAVGSVTEDPPEKLARLLEGCDAIIHLVGIIAEVRNEGQTFERVHVHGTENLLQAAKIAGAGATRFVYVSAIGAAPDAPAEYSRTKATAERLTQESGLPWTVFRPSLIFAPGAAFLQQIESLLKKPPLSLFPLPFAPVPGDGQNRFQPVYLGDLARCIVSSLTTSEATNRLYEIGGADEVTFDELIARVGTFIGVAKPLLHVPLPLLYVAAAALESVLPHPPVTTDQLQNLRRDNVCDNTAIRTVFRVSPLPLEQTLKICYADD